MPEPRCANCDHPRRAEDGSLVHDDDYCYAEPWDGDGVVPCDCRKWAEQSGDNEPTDA